MIHVVAAAVISPNGEVLIAERPMGKRLGGYWEFPGGKLENGETRTQALSRELREELGIDIRNPRPLMRVSHAYEFGEVLIDMWVVSRYEGEPQGLDGQRLRWCTLDELSGVDLLPADQPLVRALRLPERLTSATSPYFFIGDFPVAGTGALQGAFCDNPEEGASIARRAMDFLVMRRAVDADELAALCDSVTLPVFAAGLELAAAWKLGATGVSELTSH